MYYPKSQIKTNLYTNGDEYTLSTTKENYKGFYYELSNGKLYTGKTTSDKPNILLLPQTLLNDIPYSPYAIEDNSITLNNSSGEENETYIYLDFRLYPKVKSFRPRTIPIYNPTIPTTKDYNLGVFTRYFCKKNNELKYIEIDEKTYNLLKLKSNQLAWDLYSPLLVLWYLNGEKEKVFQTNKGLVNLIERQNKWYGFSQYFKDNYTKYYQSQDTNNLYTSGSEFTTKNGQNYIGFYHMHNGTIPMVGKTHMNTPHDVLTLIKNPQPTSQTTSSMVLPTIPNIPSGGGSYGGGGGSY
jgi:hypothetical protein